jgi:hypothetical protein
MAGQKLDFLRANNNNRNNENCIQEYNQDFYEK